MEIPLKARQEADRYYEAYDNQNYVISIASNRYIPKKGNVFTIRHYHHIDRNRKNNEIWNLAPLSYDEHITEIHSKNNKQIQRKIYENMCQYFPEYENHYRKYLLEK